jgi:hypothetical protein
MCETKALGVDAIAIQWDIAKFEEVQQLNPQNLRNCT